MKSFNKKYVSLKGLDNNISEQLKNLNGKEINECCGCYGDCCKQCEPTSCCTDNNSKTFIKYYNDYEVIDNLKIHPTVQDLFNIHRQYNNKSFVFGGCTPNDATTPLYFTEPGPIIQQLNGSSLTKYAQYNQDFHNFVMNLHNQYQLTYPTILSKMDGTIQLFSIKGTGTNGQEGSIKNSLIEIAELLDNLESYEAITWAQVLDVAIDNIDDIYTFVITCTIDINKLGEE